MSYYVLNTVGYEDYEPVWFESNLSKEDFKKAVTESISESLPKILKEDNYVNGHDILIGVSQILNSKGFKKINPDLELSLMGECLYDVSDIRPEIISEEDWQEILKHNQKIHDELHKK